MITGAQLRTATHCMGFARLVSTVAGRQVGIVGGCDIENWKLNIAGTRTSTLMKACRSWRSAGIDFMNRSDGALDALFMNRYKHAGYKNLESILVVGGTGLVGSTFVPKLVQMGYTVYVVTRNAKRAPAGTIAIEADISNKGWPKLLEAVGKIDALIYAAYSTSRDIAYDRRINIGALQEIVGATNIQRLIFLSSVGVFGTTTRGGEYNEQSPRIAESPYQQDKIDAEVFLEQYPQVDATILYLSIVYDRTSPRIADYRKLLALGYLLYQERGEGYYNIVHVDDVADAILLALRHKKSALESYIVNGECILYKDWIAMLDSHFGFDKRPRMPAVFALVIRGPLRKMIASFGLRVPLRITNPKATLFETRTCFSSSKIKQHMQWAPKRKYREVFHTATITTRGNA